MVRIASLSDITDILPLTLLVVDVMARPPGHSCKDCVLSRSFVSRSLDSEKSDASMSASYALQYSPENTQIPRTRDLRNLVLIFMAIIF